MTTSSTTRKRLVRSTAAAAVAVALSFTAACGGSDSSADGGSGSKLTTITLATPFPDGTPGAIPNWLGEKLGYFKEEGLDVKIVSLAGQPAQAVGLVSAGKADLVNSVPDTLLVPASKGQDIGLKWVFTAYQAPSLSVVVPEDSSIMSAKDLDGKKVAMPSVGAPFETFARANVSADGGDGTSVKTVAVPVAAAMEQVRKGAIDAVVANNSELATSASAAGLTVRSLPLPASVAQTFAAGFLVRNDASASQMEAYGRYLRAYIKAGIFAQENPEAAISMNWDKFPASKPKNVDEATAMKQGTTSLLATVSQFKKGTNGQWGYLAPERWDADIAYLGLTGKIKDVAKLHDDALLKTINDFDEAAVKTQAKDWTK